MGLGLFLCLPLAHGWAYAPVLPPNEFIESLAFEHLDQTDGLSYYLVSCIEQDQTGFIWIGTENGLNRYDGNEVLQFYHDPEDANSLSNNEIFSLKTGPDGYLWVGTASGLNRMNPRTFEVDRYPQHSDHPESLRNNQITDLHFDQHKRLWISTRHDGLVCFNLASQETKHWRHDPDDPATLASNGISCITEDQAGNLWLGLHDDGFINRIDPKTGAITRFMQRVLEPEMGREPTLQIPEILDIEVTSNGDIFAGSWMLGLFRYDPDSQTFDHYLAPSDPNPELHSSIVMSLYEGKHGYLWAGTRNDGVYLFDPKREGFHPIRHIPGDDSSLGDNTVLSFYEDDSGGVWLGTLDDGVSRYSPQQNHFRHFYYDPKTGNTLSDSNIYALERGPEGDIWIGTDGGGLNRLDTETGEFEQYSLATNEKVPTLNYTVISLLADSRNHLWVGQWNGPLSLYDMEEDTFTYYYEDESSPSANHDSYIRALCKDEQGRIWVGTEFNGVSRLDPQTGQFTHYEPDPNDPNSISDDFIRNIYCDSEGTIWVGTDTQGLNVYRPESDDFKVYRADPAQPGALMNGEILDIYESQAGSLWVGTVEGLHRFDRENDIFEVVSFTQAKSGNVIKAILEDGNGYLWISTNNGIYRFHPQTGETKHFTTQQGLQSLSFTINTACKGKDGELYFGGLNGLNRIWPNQIHENEYKPPIAITKILVNDQPISLDFLRGDDPILRLPHDRNFLTFHFAALNYTNPAQNTLAYRLRNIETEWNESGEQQSARYTTLAPGEYTFEVIGANNDGVWNREGTSVQVIIEPPFWQTVWFWSLCLVIAATLIFILDRRRVYQMHERRRWLAAEVENKTRQLRDQSQALQDANQKLEALSFLDGLTGIANRRKLDDYVEVEWRRARRDQKPIAIILADIDHFKHFNDLYGHQAGDDCLIAIAESIQRNVHRAGDLVARYGGEEFIAVLINTSATQAEQVAKRIQQAVSDLAIPHEQNPPRHIVTLSMGISSGIPHHSESIQELIKKADDALYQAKTQGRDRIDLAP